MPPGTRAVWIMLSMYLTAARTAASAPPSFRKPRCFVFWRQNCCSASFRWQLATLADSRRYSRPQHIVQNHTEAAHTYMHWHSLPLM